MHSNFITPPDYIKSVLIIDATEDQLKIVAEHVQGSEVSYNIYLYNSEMNNSEWLEQIQAHADVVLDAKINNPTEYFTK
jgi:hypothetical protein